MRVGISPFVLALMLLGSVVPVFFPFSSAGNSQNMLSGTVTVEILTVSVSANTTHVGGIINIVTTIGASWIVFDFGSFYVKTYYEDHLIDSHLFYVLGTGQEIFNVTSVWNTTGVEPGSYVISAVAYGSNMDGYVDGVVKILPVRTWIVDDDGPADFTVIQDGINAASDGDTVFVRNGTYYEHVLVNKSIFVVGENREATIIEGGGGGYVIQIAADDVLVKGFEVRQGIFGVFINHSNNCVLSDNSVTGIVEYYAVYVYFSQNCMVEGNIVGPNLASGVLVTNSEGFTISENRVFDNGGYGLNANASINGVISWNEAFNNSYDGVGLGKGSNNCTVFANNITGNGFYGIWLDSDSFDNLIYYNDIFKNGMQVYVNLENSWDNGYPSGGNYWSDYVGNDSYSGRYQNETGGDGIGDTQYVIDANNTDDYPLMNPWIPPDIAVIDLTTSKTIVASGRPITLDAQMENLGYKVEAFTVDVFLNGSLLSSESCTITGGNLNFIIIWDTADFAKGNYSVTVLVEPLQDELNIANNNMTTHIFITIAGDLNGDKTVDIYDAVILANHFGLGRYHPMWDPNVDLNDDGIIDIFDAIAVAANFGKSWT